MARPLLDMRTNKGRRVKLIPFGSAPLLTVSLGDYRAKTPPACVVDVVEAIRMRDALSEFIEQVQAAGGDPLLEAHHLP